MYKSFETQKKGSPKVKPKDQNGLKHTQEIYIFFYKNEDKTSKS